MQFNKIFSYFFIFLSIVMVQCSSAEEKKSEPFFFSFDKTKIAFTDEGQGTPVLLIHGFISNGTSWNKTVLKPKIIIRFRRRLKTQKH